MPTPDDPQRAATLRLVSAYQTLLGQKRWDEWIGLWSDDGELDFPFAPAGRQRTYRGKDEILGYMRATPGRVAVDAVDQVRLFPMLDPQLAVAELTIRGHAPATGAPYNQSYVLFFETEGGKLRRYREYWNPLVSIDAQGGREAWTQGFGWPAPTRGRGRRGMSVLITGGTGKTGRRLAERLVSAGAAVRIAARTPPARADGRRFDWNAPETWAAAVEGVFATYLVPPPGGAAAAMIDFARFAQDRGCRRFVLLSASLLPAGGPGAGQVHLWLQENAAEWAVLRPSWFMQNFSEGPHRATIRAEGRIYSAAADGKVAFISADDIADVASVLLPAPTAANADLVLTGPAAISYDDVAAVLSQTLGRAVTHVRISVDDLAERHRRAGLIPGVAQILAGMDLLIAGGADRTTGEVERITGRAPAAFAAFCQANAQAWA